MGNQNSTTSHVNSEKISFFHYINVNPDSPDLRDKWLNLSAPPELENKSPLPIQPTNETIEDTEKASCNLDLKCIFSNTQNTIISLI